jgi:hypothetical protein
VSENIDQIGETDSILRQIIAEFGQKISDPAAVFDFFGAEDGGHESTTMKNGVSAIVSEKMVSCAIVQPYIWAGRWKTQWYIQVRRTAAQ